MNTIVTPGNTSCVATLSGHSQNVSQHRITHQYAAMHAALLVRFQYSPESKSRFRHECLDHLKASLSQKEGASA